MIKDLNFIAMTENHSAAFLRAGWEEFDDSQMHPPELWFAIESDVLTSATLSTLSMSIFMYGPNRLSFVNKVVTWNRSTYKKSKNAEDREIVRRAEFNAPHQQQPGNVIKLYVLTDKLPQLLGYKPNSTGEELAVAFLVNFININIFFFDQFDHVWF